MILFPVILMVLMGCGVGVLSLLCLLKNKPGEKLLFAVPTGFILLCGPMALLIHQGWGADGYFWLLCVLGVLGCLRFMSEIRSGGPALASCRWALGLASLGLMFMYFQPYVEMNGVLHKDQTYTWMDVDSQYDMALAASIAMEHPPDMPGMSGYNIAYHYAAYGLGAQIHKLFGVELGQAMHVVQGLGLIAFLGAVTGFGFAVFPGGRGRNWVPVAAVLGGAFLGSWSTGFENLSGGEFAWQPMGFSMLAHFHFGHSVLWGLIILFSILGMLIVQTSPAEERQGNGHRLLVLGALGIPLNYLAGLMSSGVIIGVVFLMGWRSWGVWVKSLFGLVVPMVVLALFGFFGSATSSAYTLRFSLPEIMAAAAPILYSIPATGFIIISLCAWSGPFRGLKFMLPVLIGGCGAFALVVNDSVGTDNLYPLYLLHHILGALALVWMLGPFVCLLRGETALWNKANGTFWTIWMIITLLCSLLLGMVWGITGEPVVGCLLILLVAGLLMGLLIIGARRWCWVSWVMTGGTIIVVAGGVLSSVAAYNTYARGPSAETIRLSAGEYADLKKLSALTSSDDLFAVNKHKIREKIGWRSYQYQQISGRKFFLEGWQYGENRHPVFEEVKEANRQIFSETSPENLRELLEKYGIDYIVCRPKTRLKLPQPYPDWLEKMPDMKALRVYKVKPSSLETMNE